MSGPRDPTARACPTLGAALVLLACASRPTITKVPQVDAPEVAIEEGPAQPSPPVAVERAPPPPSDPSPMDEIAGLDPDAQWAWAVARFPALAEHAALDRTELVAKMAAWFPEGRVFVRVAGGKCFPVRGAWTGDAFVGRSREQTKIEGKTKEHSWLTVEVAPTGIVETGPGGETLTKNAKGKWEVTGGWGVGCMDVLVQRSVSEVTPDAVYFAGYDYWLTIECAGTRATTDVCEGGGTRECTTCGGLWAKPHASGMGFGHGSVGVMGRGAKPIDCSAPCPPDTKTPLIEPLDAIVRGRRFTGTSSLEGAVYKSRRTCERDPRWTTAAPSEDDATSS